MSRVGFRSLSPLFLFVEHTPCDCAQIASWMKRHWSSTTETFRNRELLSRRTKSNWSWILIIAVVAASQWTKPLIPMELIQVEVTKWIIMLNNWMEICDAAASTRMTGEWYVKCWRHLKTKKKSFPGSMPSRWKVPIRFGGSSLFLPEVLCNQPLLKEWIRLTQFIDFRISSTIKKLELYATLSWL